MTFCSLIKIRMELFLSVVNVVGDDGPRCRIRQPRVPVSIGPAGL